MERNPGPSPTSRTRSTSPMSPMSAKPGKSFDAALKVISYNVRGLKDENKLRHLLNGFYKRNGGKNRDFMA